MSNGFFDFTKGQAAEKLKAKGIESFRFWRNIQMEELKEIEPEEVEFKGGFAFYYSGDDSYLVFYYKKSYFTLRFNVIRQFPKFHPYYCEAREYYSGYVYSNKFPVTIYSRDEKRDFNVNLKLCKNCEKTIFKKFWTRGKEPWYEVILKFVANEESPNFRSDGYHTMWKQISEAYREKVGWQCEGCRIKLESQEDKYYLHTHHKDGNPKNNNDGNFQALCLLCHALMHQHHLKSMRSLAEIEDFINQYKAYLPEENIQKIYNIKGK